MHLCLCQCKLLQRETGVTFAFVVAGEEVSGKKKGLQIIPYVKCSDYEAYKFLKDDKKSLDDDLSIKVQIALQNQKAGKAV